jgi:GNAT superfamily N-acetyltransferase
MARMHARSWPVAYRGLLPDELIANVVANETGRAERWRRRLMDPSAPGSALVAERDDQLVGLVFWGLSEDGDAAPGTAEVLAVYLDPEAVGQGIGRALFAAAVADIESRGHDVATLWVLADNARARRFYEAAGWRPDGTTKVERRPGGDLREVRYRLDPVPRR